MPRWVMWVSRVLFVAVIIALGLNLRHHLEVILYFDPAGERPADIGFMVGLFAALLANVFGLMFLGPYAVYSIGAPTLIERAEHYRRVRERAHASRGTRLRWTLLGGTIPRTPRWGYWIDPLPRVLLAYTLVLLLFGKLLAPLGLTASQRQAFWGDAGFSAALVTLSLTAVLFLAHNWFGWWGQKAHVARLQAGCILCGARLISRVVPTLSGQVDDATVTLTGLACRVCPQGHMTLFPDDDFLADYYEQWYAQQAIPVSRAAGPMDRATQHCYRCGTVLAAARVHPARVAGTIDLGRIPPFELVVAAPAVDCPNCATPQIYATLRTQDAIMATIFDAFPIPGLDPPDPFGEYLNRVLTAHPAAPRPVAYGETLGVVLQMPTMLLALGFGGMFGGLFGILAFNDLIDHFGPAENIGFIRALFLVMLLPLLAPLIYARNVQHKLRVGERAEAEALAGRSSPPGDTRSLGALDNGLAIGRRRVDYRTGPVEEEFKTDRPWTQQLGIGARIAVLVDPARPQVWFDIGVLSATPEHPPPPAR